MNRNEQEKHLDKALTEYCIEHLDWPETREELNEYLRSFPMPDPLKPPASLLCKLGSIVVHVEEMSDPLLGHHFDKSALDNLLADVEVREWIAAMGKLALLPVKRTVEDLKLAAKRKAGAGCSSR